MNDRYLKWYTPWLRREFGMLAFGDKREIRLIAYHLSGILNSKGIKHRLDDGRWRGHDWNYWQDMLPSYLSKLC